MSEVGVDPTAYPDGEWAPTRIAEEAMEQRAIAESGAAWLPAGQMMPADLEATATPERSCAAGLESHAAISFDKGVTATAFDCALTADVVSKNIRLLTEPDVNSTSVGRLCGGEHDVDRRIVASNGRVYLRLKDQSGWVCTTSRKDEESIVVRVGPVAVGGETLVALLKDFDAAGFMPKSKTVEDYPEVVALADALKQVMAQDDVALLWARVWGVLRGMRCEAGVRWVAGVLAGDAALKNNLLEDLPGFAKQFAELHRKASATLPRRPAWLRNHLGSGASWVEAFETDGGVNAFERATTSMTEFLEKRGSLHSDDIASMMEALEGVFPFSLKKGKGGKPPTLAHYGPYNSLDASRGLLLALQHNGLCQPTPISQPAYEAVQKKMADGGAFLRRLQLQNVSALFSLRRGDGDDAASCWMTMLALTCEFNQLIAARSRFQSQGECAAVLELRALVGFPRMISSEGTLGHGHARGECFAVRHLTAALKKVKLTDTRAASELRYPANVLPVRGAGLRMYSASVAKTRGRNSGPARDTRAEAEIDMPILEALVIAGPAGQVLLQGWTAGSYDSSAVQRALATIPPLQAERAAAASAVKAVKRTNAENAKDTAPTASKKRKMSTGLHRASGDLRLPQGHVAKVENADPALRLAFERASKRLDSVRHSEESSSSRYRQLLAERAALYGNIDPEYAVPSAFQALASTLTGKVDKFSASLENLCASLRRDLSSAIDATTEMLGGTDAGNV